MTTPSPLRTLWENAMRLRRGKTARGTSIPRRTEPEINAYIRDEVSTKMPDLGSRIYSMRDLTAAMLQEQTQQARVDAPPAGLGEKALGAAAEFGAGTTLNLAKRFAPDYFQNVEENVLSPRASVGANLAGTLPTYALGGELGAMLPAAAGGAGVGVPAAGGLMAAGQTAAEGGSPGDAAMSGLLGTAVTAGGGVAGKWLAGYKAPAARVGEEILHRAGGEAGLADATAKLGTPGMPPTLSEISPTAKAQALTTGIKNPEARQALLADAQATLKQIRDAKDVVAQQYEALNKPIKTKAVKRIMQRAVVQDVLADLKKANVALPEQYTGRVLNDVRQALLRDARAASKAGGAVNIARAKELNDAAAALRTQLEDHISSFAAIQAEIGPYINRELDQQAVVDRLKRLPRGGRVSTKPGLHHTLQHMFGTTPQQLDYKAAGALAPQLMRPAPPDALAAGLHGLWPWYTRGGAQGLLPGMTQRGQRRRIGGLLQ